MKNLIIIVLSILLFYLKTFNCTLIGLGRREEGDKILYKQYFQTEDTRKLENHTILIKMANDNPITFIRFFPSTALTTSSVTYDGILIKFVEFTAYNTTSFHINVTVYGYDRPPAMIKTKSSLYYELLKLDRMVDSKLNSNSHSNSNKHILNIHTNYNENLSGSDNNNNTSGNSDNTTADYDDTNMDELFSLIASMKLKNFNLSITNDRLIPIYNQYNEKLITNNNNNNNNSLIINNDNTSSSSSNNVMTTAAFLIHAHRNYFHFWNADSTSSSTTSTPSPLPPRLLLSRFYSAKFIYLIYYSLVLFTFVL